MSLINLLTTITHMVFAGVWTGSVIFVSLGVLPFHGTGLVSREALGRIVERERWVTRISALVLLITGGPLTSSQYSISKLIGSTRGYAVLAMIVLWVVLVTLIETAGSQVHESGGKATREIPEQTQWLFDVAALSAVLLLIVSGYLVVG